LKEGAIFKSVILTNADKLTIDAQSALRRCIELFSSSTRFFIVVENKDSLLKPILSRFCDIYIPPPVIAGAGAGMPVNLHTYFADRACGGDMYKIIKARDYTLSEMITIHPSYLVGGGGMSADAEPTREEYTKILDLSVSLYEQGYCALDVIDFVHAYPNMIELKRYELLIMFDKVRKEFRNEKLLMLYLLHFIVFRCKMSLENISFM
jgi:hypothetical protein